MQRIQQWQGGSLQRRSERMSVGTVFAAHKKGLCLHLGVICDTSQNYKFKFELREFPESRFALRVRDPEEAMAVTPLQQPA